ncbi:PREDICTED: uncharacterized protein LOC104720327 [Camelina sativa]|uniref:Uncharacterized protein LOC104720327 n=1 Tax=Camelina sativa TaxID=90675 RepID=A0ABM0U6B5_CAMSA|nr:PREDICTED: uncharacterized protein LOC104720327 [Camelina sativa]
MNVRPFVQLDDLNPALDRYKIRVRIIRLWKSFKSLQMVFVDSDGTRIHASIEDGLVNRFQNHLAVGESKIVDTFNLVDYDNVIGQIVGVGNLDSVKTKGKDNVKLSFDLQELTYVEDEPSPQKSKVTLYEEFFIINGKSTMDQIVYALDTQTCVTIATIYSVEVLPKWYYIACKVCNKKVRPYPLESQSGKELLYSCGVCDADVTDVDYKKNDKSAYVVEKFWEKDDMVVQFGKKLYGRNELSNITSDMHDHKLQFAPAESSLASSKRDHTETDVVSVGGHSMKTRKNIKTESKD